VGAVALLLTLLTGGAAAGGRPVLEVRPGASFPVHVDGFAPRAAVTLRMIGLPGTTVVRANARGVLHTHYRAPRTPGHYRLAVTGLPWVTSVPTPPDGGPGAAVFRVTVPRLALIPVVVVRGGHGSEGEHNGPPAWTGTNLLVPVLVGIALVVLGLASILTGRRRRRDAGR
jgi:hypothetical protein